MGGERGRCGPQGWQVTVLIGVPLIGVMNAAGPPPFAAIGFAVNLTVLGVLGGRALFGRAELTSVERAMVALALPVGVLVLGTVAASALRLHLDRRFWALMVALTAEAAATGMLFRRAQPGKPVDHRRWRRVAPRGWLLWCGSLAAGIMLVAAIALSVWASAHQPYPAFSSLSAIRTSSGRSSVRIELTSEERAPTRFTIAISSGSARPDSIALRLAPGVTWRKTILVPGSTAVTVIAYRGTDQLTPYRKVYLAAGGGG